MPGYKSCFRKHTSTSLAYRCRLVRHLQVLLRIIHLSLNTLFCPRFVKFTRDMHSCFHTLFFRGTSNYLPILDWLFSRGMSSELLELRIATTWQVQTVRLDHFCCQSDRPRRLVQDTLSASKETSKHICVRTQFSWKVESEIERKSKFARVNAAHSSRFLPKTKRSSLCVSQVEKRFCDCDVQWANITIMKCV